MEDITPLLQEYFTTLKNQAQKGDYLLVQIGATYQLVNFAKTLGLIPIYATHA